MLNWPHHCGPVTRENIIAGEDAEESCLLHDGQEAERVRMRRRGGGQDIPLRT
jgi:hypothetical protein